MTQEEFHKRYHYNPNTDCLGEGGFGKVYKAFDTHRDRYVAIKMAEVKPHLEEVRLRKEVETISKLPTHPNVAYYEECYTFSTFAGEYDFGVLQYYELGNLEQLLRAKQLTNEQKDTILRQILQGIEFLHSQGIIHRDLKPQNILVVDRNGEYIPKITDFGISKKLDINKSSVFTNSLAGVGTLAFASPEQLLGTTIRKNTDLWSFGVITCWMFTGKLPFNTGNQTATSEAGRIELFKQITAGDIISTINQLPTLWCNLVKECIMVDVEKRISGVGKCLQIVGLQSNVLKKELPATESGIRISEGIIDSKKTVISRYEEEKNNETVTDIDGNVYKTVRIGNQIWMAENLRVSRYRNGAKIPNVIRNDHWKYIKEGLCCNYENNPNHDIGYGKLYNWHAVSDKKGLAPSGWHIPSEDEWDILIWFLGGYELAGDKLKEKGTKHWSYPNEGATNESSFFALPGGSRESFRDTFAALGLQGNWWSATESNSNSAWTKHLYYNNSLASRGNRLKYDGLSVRCVKDSIADKAGTMFTDIKKENRAPGKIFFEM